MALTKTPVNINFLKGLDTKTDPYQVSADNFIQMQNSVFTTAGRITKRNGFANITTLPNQLQTTITTINDNLVATGSNLYALSQDTNQWLNQGIVQPVQLNVLPLVRVSTSQSSPDMAVSTSGLACLVYIDNAVAYYQISDNTTGQQIIKRTALPTTATNPRVFLLGNYFIITFIATVSGSPHLRYIAIPINNPSSVGTATDFSSTTPLSSSLTAGYDGYVLDLVGSSNLYVAWAGASTTIKIAYLTSSLVGSTVVSIASHTSTLMSVTVDNSVSASPIVWVTFWDSSSTNGYTTSYNSNLTVQTTAVTEIITSTTIEELTSTANTGVMTAIYENFNTYSSPYPVTGVQTDYLSTVTCTQAAVVSSTTIILRSVGLASKAFIGQNGTIYVIATYGERNTDLSPINTDQNTYFLIDSLGNIYMRLAYANGGGYETTQVLPSVSAVGSNYYYPYLITDFLATTNKTTNSSTPLNTIYTQTGINLANFTINTTNQYSSEIAGSLFLTGGQLWQYDGVKPVEQGFQVWPDNVQAAYTEVSTVTPTGTALNGSTSITVSSATGVAPGMTIMDSTNSTYIPAGTIIVSVNGTTVIMSEATTHAISGDTLSIQGNMAAKPSGAMSNTNAYFYQFCYEWTDNQGNLQRSAPSVPVAVTTAGSGTTGSVTLYVPTLRLTYKIAPNPVRLVGYRWSVGQQIYYQFTSITAPLVNDPTVDYLTVTDPYADSSILGNVILYTTGGVVEDIAAPPSVHSCLFNDRLWLIDAEDQNLLWYSKQVIEDTPVEMSDLLTIYVAPTLGAQGSTGVVTALSAMDDKLIIFKKDAIYYINGIGPDNTGANSTYSDPVFVTSSVGCANPNSIVLMPSGIMFQSDKGIWLLGRDLSTNYIGAPVEAYNNDIVKSAQTIPGTNQVRFILDDSTTLMYDYYFQQWGTFTNILAISATLWQGRHTYLNSKGSIFQETPGTYLDGSTPVLMSFTSAWMNLAGLQGFERFYSANLLGTYYTPFKLNVQYAYNYNSSPQQATIVTPDNYGGQWGSQAVWGSGGNWGGSEGNVFTARIFPQVQKCQSFQVSIQELYDPSFGVAAGEGLSLSGMVLQIGVKRGTRTQSAAKSFG